MAQKERKTKRITVRLDYEAAKKVEEANARGFSTSQYINKIIKGSSSCEMDIRSMRSILMSISRLQSQLEFETDPVIKKNMREELNQICRVLKSFQNHT